MLSHWQIGASLPIWKILSIFVILVDSERNVVSNINGYHPCMNHLWKKLTSLNYNARFEGWIEAIAGKRKSPNQVATSLPSMWSSREGNLEFIPHRMIVMTKGVDSLVVALRFSWYGHRGGNYYPTRGYPPRPNLVGSSLKPTLVVPGRVWVWVGSNLGSGSGS